MNFRKFFRRFKKKELPQTNMIATDDMITSRFSNAHAYTRSSERSATDGVSTALEPSFMVLHNKAFDSEETQATRFYKTQELIVNKGKKEQEKKKSKEIIMGDVKNELKNMIEDAKNAELELYEKLEKIIDFFTEFKKYFPRDEIFFTSSDLYFMNEGFKLLNESAQKSNYSNADNFIYKLSYTHYNNYYSNIKLYITDYAEEPEIAINKDKVYDIFWNVLINRYSSRGGNKSPQAEQIFNQIKAFYDEEVFNENLAINAWHKKEVIGNWFNVHLDDIPQNLLQEVVLYSCGREKQPTKKEKIILKIDHNGTETATVELYDDENIQAFSNFLQLYEQYINWLRNHLAKRNSIISQINDTIKFNLE